MLGGSPREEAEVESFYEHILDMKGEDLIDVWVGYSMMR